jgi:hypothetical protein
MALVPRTLGLTKKQAKFAAEYVVDLNATQAAIRAGYSPSSARQTASELLQNPHVKAEIVELEQAQLKRTGITAELVLETLRRVMTFDIATIYEYASIFKGHQYKCVKCGGTQFAESLEKGSIAPGPDPCCGDTLTRTEQYQHVRKLKHPADWPPEARTCLQSFDTVVRNLTAGDGMVDTVLKVKLADRLQAAEMLAKHLGLMTEKVEVNQEITMRWLAPEPPPEVETITIDAQVGTNRALPPWQPGELAVRQEEMGSAAGAVPPSHRTHARIFSDPQSEPSSAILESVTGLTPAEVEARSGVSMARQRKIFPELREE